MVIPIINYYYNVRSPIMRRHADNNTTTEYNNIQLSVLCGNNSIIVLCGYRALRW